MGNQLEFSGLLTTREQAEVWCGGMTEADCALHCEVTFGSGGKATCNPKYVVNLKY